MKQSDKLRTDLVTAHSDLVTERAAHAGTSRALGESIELAGQRLAHAHQLQADIDAETEWRLNYRNKHDANRHETMMGFLDRVAAERSQFKLNELEALEQRDSALAAANRHLSCTAKAVAELEEAKGLLREAPASEWNAFWMAGYDEWLKRRDALLSGAGAKTHIAAPLCCTDCGHVDCTCADERAGGEQKPPTQGDMPSWAPTTISPVGPAPEGGERK